jgi:medium-chain acyl-[acyl-carrier-protein] hydrolase
VGANVYRDWDLGNTVEVAAVQLPSRKWRRHERTLTRIDAVVSDLMPAVEDWFTDDRPAVFFGYSMDAAVSYALASRLLARNDIVPAALFVAACRALHLLKKITPIYTLDDNSFVSAIQRLGGMPDAILNEPELLEFALPVLRADFEVLGTYQCQDQVPLDMPVIAYGGNHDPLASRSELSAWRAVTTGDFSL